MTDYKKQLVEAGRRMKSSALTVDTFGNISLRDPKSGLIYLTPSAMDYDDIKKSDIVVCDIDGNVIEGNRKPTIEKDLHFTVYRAREDVNAVLHTHPTYSLAFACLGEDIPLITDEAALILMDRVRVAEYSLPGTMKLAKNCVEALGSISNACLLRSHGAVCVGSNITRAFNAAFALEMTAQVYYMAKMMGSPAEIPASAATALRDFAMFHYGQDKQ